MTKPISKTSSTLRAFTLLEMLLVVTILGAVATSLLIAVNDKDDDRRYETTKDLVEQVRFAATGFSGNGNISTNNSGYIADLGELPDSIGKLMRTEHPDSSDTTNNVEDRLSKWKQVGRNNDDSAWGAGLDATEADKISIFHGWRGPYLVATGGGLDEDNADADEDINTGEEDFRFRDAWGNDLIIDTESANGVTSGELYLFSLGKDRVSNPVSDLVNRFERDFPTTDSFQEIPESLYKLQTSTAPEITFTYGTGNDLRVGVIFAGIDLTTSWDTSTAVTRYERGLNTTTVTAVAAPLTGFAVSQTVILPATLFNDRFARQFQVVFYEENGSGTLANRIHYIAPHTFTIPLQASPEVKINIGETIPPAP